MTKRGFSYFLCLSPLLLAGCDTFTSKTPIPGKREAIFENDFAYKAVVAQNTAMVTLPAGTHNKSWPIPGGNLANAMPPLALSEKLDQKWSTSIGSGHGSDRRFTSNLVVENGIVYALDTYGQVSALRLSDGSSLWSASTMPAETEALGGGIAVDHGIVYVTTSAGEVLALRGKDGKELWRKSLQTPIRTAPTLAHGKMVVINIANEAYALDTKTGDILWTHAGLPESTGILGGASPSVSGNSIVIPYSSGEICVLDFDSGRPKWIETLTPALSLDSLSSISHIRARPIIYDQKVYVISYGGRLASFNLETGARLWQREYAGIRTPAIFENYLFLVTLGNELICINRHSGELVWSVVLQTVDSSNKQKVQWAGPVIAGGNLILTGDNGTVEMRSLKNGQLVHSLQTSENYSLSPIIVDGYLLALSNSARITAWK